MQSVATSAQDRYFRPLHRSWTRRGPSMPLTEAQWVASHVARLCGQDPLRALRLQPRWSELLAAIPGLGLLSSRTHSSAARLRVVRQFEWKPTTDRRQAMFHARDAKLAIDIQCWRSAFVVQESSLEGLQQHGLRVYDAHGARLLQLDIAAQDADLEALGRLQATLGDPRLLPGVRVSAPPPAGLPRPDHRIDPARLARAWSRLRHPSQWEQWLALQGLQARQACRLAPAGMAQPLDNHILPELIARARTADLRLAFEVGSPGARQTAWGHWHLKRLATAPEPSPATGTWEAAMRGAACLQLGTNDADLLLDEAQVDQSWRISIATPQGLYSWIECYADSGQTVLRVLPDIHPGTCHTRCRWLALLRDLV